MTLIRWSPVHTSPVRAASIHDEIDRLFDGVLGGVGYGPERGSSFSPAVDVEETPEEFVVRADLPGLSQKDVRVTLLEDTLTLRGERKFESESKDRNFRRIERRTGVFERAITFGVPVRGDAVKAQVRDGVLEVHVPKADQARVRDIEIEIAS